MAQCYKSLRWVGDISPTSFQRWHFVTFNLMLVFLHTCVGPMLAKRWGNAVSLTDFNPKTWWHAHVGPMLGKHNAFIIKHNKIMFLVHLSQRLKCTIVITLCPSSVILPSLTFHIFHFSSETAERNLTKLDRKQDLNVLYQVCVFGPIEKTRWPPWPLIGWDIFDFSSVTAERNSTKLDRKQDLNVLY